MPAGAAGPDQIGEGCSKNWLDVRLIFRSATASCSAHFGGTWMVNNRAQSYRFAARAGG
jgi:hypothetical protein